MAGVRQVGRGYRNETELIMAEFQAYLGAEESFDAVYIKGVPHLEVVIKGGVNGDVGTVAVAVNAIARGMAAPSGLITMKDLPPVHASQFSIE